MSKFLSNLVADTISLTATSPLSIDSNNTISISANPVLSTLNLTSTQTSTSITTGSLTTSGGIGVGKSLTVGTNSTLGMTYAKQITSPANQTYYIPGTTVLNNSTLNLFTSVNNGGDTSDTPYPILTMIKPGVNNQSYDNVASFYLNRYLISGSASASELQLGLAATTVSAGADPNFICMKWRSDGVNTIMGTGDSTSLTTGVLRVNGGIGCAKTVYGKSFKTLGGTGFALTTTLATVVTFTEDQIGYLNIYGGAATWASFHVCYHVASSVAIVTLIAGANLTAQFTGAALQVKSTAGSYTMNWSYTRMM